MDDNERTLDVQSPAEQAIIGASIVCFLSLIIIYCITERALDGLGIRWVKILLCGFIPVSATFLFLYRSCWHPEITGARRTCSLFLMACIILVGVFFFIGFMLCFGFMIYHTFVDGFHP